MLIRPTLAAQSWREVSRQTVQSWGNAAQVDCDLDMTSDLSRGPVAPSLGGAFVLYTDVLDRT